jgi:hypothetical protein
VRDDGAVIEVERLSSSWTDRFRSYVVRIDGAERGRLRSGEVARFGVESGHHRLQLKVDWATSLEIEADLAPSEVARFQCKPRDNALTSVYWSTIGYRKYIELWPAYASHLGRVKAKPNAVKALGSTVTFALALIITVVVVALIVQVFFR